MRDKPHIAIINGPNLNLLGTRQPDLYGYVTFTEYFEKLVRDFPLVHFTYFQSNVEGELINEIQKMGAQAFGLVINAGGYTHTSVAIADALASVHAAVIEVHITNPTSREPYRHTSLIAQHCDGLIAGFGLYSYKLAIHALLNSSEDSQESLK